MTKSTRYILILTFILLSSKSSFSQFINLQIRIEPEITAKVEQQLTFGDLVINSGQKIIGLGDVNMGVFSIRALYTQSIYLSLVAPQALTHINPAISDNIPISLNLAYNNSGQNNSNNTTELENNFGYLKVYENNSRPKPENIWQEMFLYIYGTVDVGEVTFGEYSSDIILIVEYD